MANLYDYNAIPKMTSNTSPSGVASASLVQNNEDRYEAYRAFNGILDDANNAWVANSTNNLWISYEFENPIAIGVYGIAPNMLNNGSEPKDFRFEAYNDEGSWIVLDTQKSITNWTVNKHLYFDIKNTVKYKKYRLFIENNNGFTSYTSISNIEMYISPPVKNMVLKNPTTNQIYSLAEKTLIPLPDTSDKNMILYGIEQGTEIQLDVDFDKMKFIQDKSEVLGNGKVFRQPIDSSKTSIKNISTI